MSLPDYQVIETEMGPMVGESRTSVYDVLLSLKEGDDFFALCVIHNLKPVLSAVHFPPMARPIYFAPFDRVQ
jgi:hypothetical protein